MTVRGEEKLHTHKTVLGVTPLTNTTGEWLSKASDCLWQNEQISAFVFACASTLEPGRQR